MMKKAALGIMALGMLPLFGCSDFFNQGTLEKRVSQVENQIRAIEEEIKNLKSSPHTAAFLTVQEPTLADDGVLKWAMDSLMEIYSYNFINYKDQLTKAKMRFTEAGYNYYINALRESKNLEVLEQKKLVVSATPAGLASLLKKGVVNGVYTWDVQVPLNIDYKSEQIDFRQTVEVNIRIVRENHPHEGQKIAIQEMSAELLDATDRTKTAR